MHLCIILENKFLLICNGHYKLNIRFNIVYNFMLKYSLVCNLELHLRKSD